jgi:type IV pilus assembly protein PilX
VLFVGLVLLLVLTLVGVVLARMQTVEERMARNEHNHQIAFQAAEAALRAAETGVIDSVYSDFSGASNGLYTLVPTVASAADSLIALNWSDAAHPTLAYAGPLLADVPVARSPHVDNESLPPVAIPGDSLSAVQYGSPVPPVAIYRVTAQGVGGDTSATSVLESIIR